MPIATAVLYDGLAPAQSRFVEPAIITSFLRASQTCIRHVHTSKPRPHVLNFFIFCRSLKCTILHQNLRITHSSMHDAVGCRLMYAYVRLSCCMPSFVIPLAVTSPSSSTVQPSTVLCCLLQASIFTPRVFPVAEFLSFRVPSHGGAPLPLWRA